MSSLERVLAVNMTRAVVSAPTYHVLCTCPQVPHPPVNSVSSRTGSSCEPRKGSLVHWPLRRNAPPAGGTDQ